jgi:hypothetical protein
MFIVSSCAQQPTTAPTLTPTPMEEVPPFEEVMPEVPAREKVEVQKKGGMLYHDETWLGDILVVDTVKVPAGITLTIEPGTTIKFKHDRDYKTFDTAGLVIDGGTIKAIGIKDNNLT